MPKYIGNKKIDSTKANEVSDLKGIGKATWKFVSVFYNGEWDSFVTDINNNSFRQNISFHCTLKTNPVKNGKPKGKNNNKPASIERFPPPISAETSKEVNEISKFFKTKMLSYINGNWDMSYIQASKVGSNTKSVLKIKEVFPTLKAKNINNIQHIIKSNSKPKPWINMTTKSIPRKQVIVPMNNTNKNNFMKESSVHITNINKVLKNIKTDVMVDFIWKDLNGITIVTNKVASTLELQTIENYVKNANHINAEGVKTPRLSQSKSYFKIISISYLQENTNTSIILSVVKDIIKRNHIFNNVVLVSRPHIIKVSLRLDMAIIWVDIWNGQSGSKTKELINRCFNIGSYITTVRDANINSGIPQCKNC